MDTDFNFGKLLSGLRNEKGMSQSQLAVLLNTSQDTISLWERGKSHPDYAALKALTEIFDVSADYLFGKAEI